MFGWLLGLGILISHVGCCQVRMAGSCGDCGVPAAACGDCGINVPFSGVGHRVASHIRGARQSGACGEIYWDEQINEPRVCDPCGCDGEFTGETCGSCPTALGRLRNLWGYRYEGSQCGCSTCSGGTVHASGMVSGASTCSSCSAGEHSSHSHMSQPAPSAEPVRGQPTPAVKPADEPKSVVPPTPVPDSNANSRRPSSERLVVGSGVSPSVPPKMVKGRPVSSKQVVTGSSRPKLVTTPK